MDLQCTKGQNCMKTLGKPMCSWMAGVTVGTIVLAGTALLAGQTAYQPKFAGDPAHSESEAVALGYVRTLMRAQHTYHAKNGQYATSLMDLVHVGSFTRRMTEPEQGDYKVSFHSRKDGFELTMIPRQLDADHRSFYANEKGAIHGDDQTTASEDSPVLGRK
jgi:hypothetical protein